MIPSSKTEFIRYTLKWNNNKKNLKPILLQIRDLQSTSIEYPFQGWMFQRQLCKLHWSPLLGLHCVSLLCRKAFQWLCRMLPVNAGPCLLQAEAAVHYKASQVQLQHPPWFQEQIFFKNPWQHKLCSNMVKLEYLYESKCALNNPPMILIFVSKTDTFIFASKLACVVTISTTLWNSE